MSDVIFNGSAQRKPLGLAEVKLSISSGTGLLPNGYPEVEVTRRLYRNNESEYLINKAVCRLRDITDLFLDLGIGKGAYSLIEQGRVDALLMARPVERRGLLEQASGIMKYKVRKKEALSKLTSTERNLDRVKDIVSEVRSRRIVLARQARKAEKFRAFSKEMQELQLLITTGRFGRYRSEVLSSLEKIQTQEIRLAKISAQLGVQDASVTKAKIQEEKSASQYREIKNQSDHLEMEIDRFEEKIADFSKREEELSAEATRTAIEIDTISTRINDLAAKQNELTQNSDEVTSQIASQNEELKLAQSELESILQQYENLRGTIKTLKKSHLEIIDKNARIKNKQVELDEGLRRIRRSLEALAEEVQELTKDELQCRQAVQEAAFRVESIAQTHESLIVQRNRFRETSGNLQSQIKHLAGELKNNDIRLLELTSRIQSLKEIVDAGEGLEEGIKTVLKDFGKTHKNGRSWKMIADVFQISPEYEKAASAVLDMALQAVIPTMVEDCHDAIQYLKRTQAGRALFYLSRTDRKNDPGRLISPPPGGKKLLDFIHTESEYDAIFNSFFEDVYFVEDWENAVDWVLRTNANVTVVSSEGDILHASGVMSGGSEVASAGGYRTRKLEIELMAGETDELEQKTTVIRDQLADLEFQFKEVQSEFSDTEQQIQSISIQLAEAKKDQNHAEDRAKMAMRRKDAIETEQVLLEEEYYQISQKREELGDCRTEQTQEQEIAKEIGLKELALEQTEKELDTTRSRVSTKEIMVERSRERSGSLLRELRNSAAELARMRDMLQNLNARKEHLAEQQLTVKKKRSEAESEIENQLRLRPGIIMNLNRLNTRRENEKEVILSMEEELNQIRQRHREVEVEVGELKIKKAQQESAMTILQEQNSENLLEELKKLKELPEESEIQDWVVRVDYLRTQILELGDVNLAAVEEHKELVQRGQFLDEQVVDLETSIQSLRKTIHEINDISRTRFQDAFDNINRNFNEIFAELFSGGEAALRLEQPDDPLESGIEIVCKPPGKKARTIDLLSGGEKALSALALLFASFRYHPSPILFLDEVDASLDDSNVVRFTQFLSRLSKTTQVVMISHNPLAMEAGEVLYGVTMAEPGISKLVSAKIGML